MNRIHTQREAEVIQAAIALLPGKLPEMLDYVHFFFGDPIFSGLHAYGDVDPNVLGQDVSYRDVAHFCDPEMLFCLPKSRQHPTMILPASFLTTYRYPVETIVHELGHAIHSLILKRWRIDVEVSSYAASNDWECFAEFFAAWCYPMGSWKPGWTPGSKRAWVDQTLIQYDPESIWLFDRMAEGHLLP